MGLCLCLSLRLCGRQVDKGDKGYGSSSWALASWTIAGSHIPGIKGCRTDQDLAVAGGSLIQGHLVPWTVAASVPLTIAQIVSRAALVRVAAHEGTSMLTASYS